MAAAVELTAAASVARCDRHRQRPMTRKRIQQPRVIGPRMNRKVSWLIWGVAVLATIWLLLYAVAYYLGEVAN